MTIDPYHEWLGVPPKDQPPHHYRLLGLDLFEGSPDVIAAAADRQMAFVKGHEAGPDSEVAQRILNELAAARVCLLTPAKKAEYDAELRRKVTPPDPAPPPRQERWTSDEPEPAAWQRSVARHGTHAPRSRSHSSRRAMFVGVSVVVVIVACLAAGGALYLGKGSPRGSLAALPQEAAASGVEPTLLTNNPAEFATPEHDVPIPERDTIDSSNAAKVDHPPAPISAVEEPVSPLARPETIPPPVVRMVAAVTPVDELDKLPGAVITVAGHVPAPIDEDAKIPKQLRGGTRFGMASKPKTDIRNGVLEFTIQATGVVYLVAHWERQGERDGVWDVERLTKEQLQKRGWQFVSLWPANEKMSLFRKLCTAGESYKIRTNKYWPPAILVPASRSPASAVVVRPTVTTVDQPTTEAAALPSPALVVPEPRHKAAPPTQRLAVPDAQAQQKALELVKQIYADEYSAARTAETKVQLAKKLLGKSKETQDDPVARYALLRSAMDLAASAQDVDLTLQLADDVGRFYDVNTLAAKGKLLRDFAASKTKEVHRLIAQHSLQLVDPAFSIEEPAMARAYFEMAANSAKTARDKELIQATRSRETAVMELATAMTEYKAAVETLTATPDEQQANLTVGKWLCFHRKEWERGLPHLAKGNDEKLKALAEAELANPADATKQVELADRWYELANSPEYRQFREQCLRRSAVWYRPAVASLIGLEKVRVEKRIESLPTSSEPLVSSSVATQTPTATGSRNAASGVAYACADDKFQLAVNGKIVASGGRAGVALPGEVKVGDVIAAELTNEGQERGFMFFFASRNGKTVFFSNPATWKQYVPEKGVAWTSIRPSDSHSNARSGNHVYLLTFRTSF